MKCENCGDPLTGKWQDRFCSHRCSQQHYAALAPTNECPKCHKMFKRGWQRHVAQCDPTRTRSSKNVSHWRQVAKAKLVALFGGQCVACGYDRCIRNLSFHHRDAATKEFGISGAVNGNWNVMLAEAKKCVLLCANCHGEVHAGLRDVAKLENAGAGSPSGLLNRRR
jgi:hypothetical protein